MNLSSRKFSSLQDNVHHARTQIQKWGLEGDNWLIACFVNGIPNSDYHWIVHDKDPKSFEEAVEIVLRYQCTSKDHNKPNEAPGTKQSQLAGKRKTPNEFVDRDCKRQHPYCVFCKKNGHTKDQCRKLQRKEHDNKTKVAGHKGQTPNVLQVYTHHLSNCKFSFSHHVFGPNDLLRANEYINGSLVQFLFDSGSSHNFVNDRLV